MADRVTLVPRTGARILYPAGSPKSGRVLPAEGEEVNLDSYWRARIADGGVIIALPPEAPPAAAPKKTITREQV